MITKFVKDPGAVLDWTFDWSEWLETGETISAASAVVESNLELDTLTFDSTAVTLWLSGGSLRSTAYTVSCTITTSAGRTDTRRIQILARERMS